MSPAIPVLLPRGPRGRGHRREVHRGISPPLSPAGRESIPCRSERFPVRRKGETAKGAAGAGKEETMQTENRSQKIAVTGATGRVGSHLVEILEQRGHDVSRSRARRGSTWSAA